MTTITEEQDVDWAAFRRRIENSLDIDYIVAINEAIRDTWALPDGSWNAYERQQDRSLARSQRNSANQRRRRKHGQRR